jgi:hypothetical protein
MRFRLLAVTTIFLSAGILALICLTHPTCQCRVDKAYHKIARREDTQDPRARFKEIVAANGVTPDGHRFDFNTILSSNCVLIHESIEATSSLASSADMAHAELESAHRIIEQTLRLDANGKVTGGRAVALFGANGERASIIKWSDAGTLKLDSSSLESALDYERERTE